MRKAALQSMLDAFRAREIGWLLAVPSTQMDAVYAYYEERNRCIFATREEEAVAIAVGLTLAGERVLVLIQQSGVGNTFNAVFTLADAYDVRFPILVCDRGTGDSNPVQRVSSRSTQALLNCLGCVQIDWNHTDAGRMFGLYLERGIRWLVSPI